MSERNILIQGARVNNLKNVSVEIPRNHLVVITGVSGSGKSSLAFDTLYAEGQRRYVESLSAYARQFLGKMAKPEVDFIRGLPPAIAIEQKVNTRNPRSTVGTSTEIYDYMRLLFGRVGRTYSPVSGEQVRKHTVSDVLAVAGSYPEGTRVAVAAPIVLPEGRALRQQLEILMKGGYSRLVTVPDGHFLEIEEMLAGDSLPGASDGLMLLIDRLAVAGDGDELSRLAESAETAFFEGRDEMVLLVWTDEGLKEHRFSKRFEADGITFREPSELMFNFNNPYGACTVCEGFGKTVGIDPALVVPDTSLSVYDDAVVCWRGEKMSECKRDLIRLAPQLGFPIHKPYCELTPDELDILWHGRGKFYGIDGFFKWVDENQYKIQYRVMKARYRGKTVCPECHGSRLKPDASYVKIGGCTIMELVSMPVADLRRWFSELVLDDTESRVATRLLTEINSRIGFLCDVGLGYLTLDRLSSTLSGGESQRINLATSLGSSLVGSLYILDEPSIGLHPRDTAKLVEVLRRLQMIGNTVVIVEHDADIMRAADYLIDVGRDAGRLGGNIVYQGPVNPLPVDTADSYTVKYLRGDLSVPLPAQRRRWKDYIEVVGAREHNLKNIDVRFPLGVMTVVTGVSGSGKSTLVRDVFWRAMVRRLGEAGDAPGLHKELRGDLSRIKAVEFVDQDPIGRSSRSNAATYLKAYDEIRKLFADQQGAKQMGFTPAFFSFNTEGGRCEECKGEGTITIEMQFMADIIIPCETCHGQRFKPEILDIRYRGQNINDVLEMTVNQAIEFFGEDATSLAKKIVKRLKPLQDVGLGYIKLGQSSSTLSGGENQRVKLAYYLAQEKPEPTMFIFDEPTTGLHLNDINKLMDSFNRLIAQGHTVLIIEHNLDVIKCADHVIDIGPEGGDLGGNVVASGTPEQIAACAGSYTGRYIAPLLVK
ncbi:excinuclease ABC subunit UvrA [Muribaculum intestinale]|uniref:excinuclease ABC subunit UvrA n=1 Tax=Muribaculum intestinale TaxID=1796646 RepID=UPI000F4A0270|nr:excinuclease ABC subunit UvrA [Muribaculum intestinale]ROT07939.1 excinuclease ABC subunit A [Muribaculaceae bacterium Isolate-100 (HZI)]RXE66504.1 excinuclease ABC subunit A [Muribaculaceae bacterium Isolate-007 (NCI)]TGX87342.1 excinuclease ABC subunit A [Muribaculum intestinale]